MFIVATGIELTAKSIYLHRDIFPNTVPPFWQYKWTGQTGCYTLHFFHPYFYLQQKGEKSFKFFILTNTCDIVYSYCVRTLMYSLPTK